MKSVPTATAVDRPAHLFVLRASSPPRIEIIDGQPRTVLGMSHPDAVRLIADRILAIVRTIDPGASIVDAPFAAAVMTAARSPGAGLVMTTIKEWREGARVAGEGDRVDLELQLVRVDLADATSPRLVTLTETRYQASASGVAAAFSTSDHPASRLLDNDRFRTAVRALLQ